MNDDLRIEDVTPEKALAWLRTSSGNRRYDQRQISVYAAAMKSERWKIGNDAIIFDRAGRLRNGHHRLMAIALSGVTVRMVIRRNVPEDEIPTMDQGRPRSVKAALGDFGGGRYGEVENYHGATVRHTLFGARPQRISMDVLGDAINDAREGLDFVFKQCFDNSKKRGISAPTYAVFVRMYYAGIDKSKLIYAGRVLLDGDVPQGENRISGHQSLIALRDFLLSKKARGGGIRSDIYEKTQNMMQAFVRGEERKAATASARDIFPVPSELEKYATERPLMDAEFTLVLTQVARQLKHIQTFTMLELGEQMVRAGYKSNSDEPAKYAAAQFSLMLKRNNRNLILDGIGRFLPDNDDVQRIKLVRFEAHYH
jgi:hypothetical protein